MRNEEKVRRRMMLGGMFREDSIDWLINCHKCVTLMQDVNNGETDPGWW